LRDFILYSSLKCVRKSFSKAVDPYIRIQLTVKNITLLENKTTPFVHTTVCSLLTKSVAQPTCKQMT